jgi:hypothetical protein
VGHGKEHKIQSAFVDYLRTRGWMTQRMIGNAFQYGVPDLFAAHPTFGQRWIDIKCPDRYSFTRAQRILWPVWEEHGVGIWIITSADQAGYDALFRPPNWRKFVKKSWKIPTQTEIDRMLDAL